MYSCYYICMEFALNKQQEDIINCFFDNGICFVNASAGTGKTSTITELYIKLLENREKVSSIVVITFTKAAANEMLLRIRLKVRNKISSVKNIKEKEYWQKVYKDILTNAKISTIDSFANSIAMENALSLAMPPNASILEDNSDIKETLKDEILNVLNEVSYSETIRTIYRIYTEESKDDFADKILSFLLKIKPRLKTIDEFEKRALSVLNIEEDYKKLHNEISFLSSSLINDDGSENNTIKQFKILISNTIDSINKLSNFEDIKNIEENDLEYLINSFSGVINQKNSCGSKNAAFRDGVKSLKEIYPKLFYYIDIERNKEKYITVIRFIKDTYIHFEEVKKDIGVYSYEDIMYKAIEALEDKDISDRIRDNISTLILDEAQDTSYLQFSFINLIVFGKKDITPNDKNQKKLMIVGDKKQSIYRFRNANFRAFIEAKNNFNNYVKYLKNNYRSNSMLIEFFNDFFESVVFKGDDIDYIEEDNLQYSKESKDKSVSLLILNRNIESENIDLNIEKRTELESYSIAKYIKKYYDNNYQNVVILLQTFTRLNVYLKALSDFQIPYYIDGGNGFYEREEIVLIKTFLEYLVLRDHAKLPSLLRSELFDIDISNLSDFLFSLFIKGLDINDYFPKNINDEDNYKKILEIASSKSYYSQLKEAKELLNSIESKVSMMNASDIIETICIDTNFYNYLMTMEDAELSYANIEKLKKIADEFENQTGNNVYDFVLNLQNAGGNEAYSSIPKLSVDAVKIMTIHKSKGLEFENVFLAGMGHYMSPKYKDFDFIEDYPFIKLPVYEKNKYYTLDFSFFDKSYNDESEESEKRRLLYVALTRASNNLILSGEHSKGKSYMSYINNYISYDAKKYHTDIKSEENDDFVIENSLDNKFINSYLYGIAFEPKDTINNTEADIEDMAKKMESIKENKNELKAKTIANIMPSLRNKYDNNYSDFDISSLLDRKILELENYINNDEEDYDDENVSFILFKDLGIIIHKMLEHFDYNKYIKEKDLYLEKVKTFVLKSNVQYNQKQLSDSLDTAFKRLFENEHINNILKGYEEIVSREHTFQDYNGEYRTTGKIDLITKNKNGEYFILDYKVSKSSEENINFYTPQLESYKYMFQRAFNIDERKINTGIIFLK